jgi:uncharacterized protein YjeT (DUF2065 family)
MSTWKLIFAAIGLAIFLEGLPYLISPAGVRSYLRFLERMSDASMRAMGLALILAGLVVAYVSTR